MNKTLYLLITFWLMLSFQLSAQSNYLVKMDRATGTLNVISKIDSIPEIPADDFTFDNKHTRFVFRSKTNSNSFLTTLDTNGNILAMPKMNYNASESHGFVYSEFDNTLYASRWDPASQQQMLVSINQGSGACTDRATLQGLKYAWYEFRTIDPINRKYYMQGAESDGVRRLYSVDLNTNISSSVTMKFTFVTDSLQGMVYDHGLGKLYCLYMNSYNQKLYLSELNPVTGNFTFIDALQGIQLYRYEGRNGYDQKNHYYMLGVRHVSNGKSTVVTLNTVGAQLVYKPYISVPLSFKDYLAFPGYDSSSNNTYAILWLDSLCETPEMTIGPITETTALVNWGPPDPGKKYYYHTSENTPPPAGPGTNMTATASFMTGLKPNTVYYVCLRKECFQDVSSEWECDSFKTKEDTTAIIDTTLSIDHVHHRYVDVYPNPVTDRVTVKRDNNRNMLITITDMVGCVVYQSETVENSIVIDMQSYPGGVYFLRYDDRVRNNIIKLIKR